MKKITADTFRVSIYLAGDLSNLKDCCRRYCNDCPLCVTFSPTTFIYNGGAEDGVEIGLQNYPRFPAERAEIRQKAVQLAERLLEAAYQTSVLVVDETQTLWIHTREA